MADKQKIRNYACELLKDSQNGFGSASYNMLKMVIAYIDSLPEKPVSEDLEEASKEWDAKASFNPFYMALDDNGNPYEVRQDYTTHAESFKAGARWQKQQDQSTIELAEDHAMLAGMEKIKEQMMANGVDGVVHHFEKCRVASVHYNDPTGVPMAHFTSPEGLSAGDKVKIIVIKEG